MFAQIITTVQSDQTQALGQHIGAILTHTILKDSGQLQSKAPAAEAFVIALHGDLGAGKTTLTQGIAAGLGVTQPVTSPTYTLVNEYALDNKFTLAHVDSYRLADSGDGASSKIEAAALGIGLDELLDDDHVILIIEWASYLADLLPADHLAITLAHDADHPDNRHITIQPFGARGQAILDALDS